MPRPETIIINDERVRRIAHLGSVTDQAFLRELRKQGITFVPEPLRLDSDFEELSYMPGRCFQPHEPRPYEYWSLELLEKIGKAIRLYHDASIEFIRDNGNAQWFPYAERCLTTEVICHNDLGPWNLPVDELKQVSIIDWEMASPGKRVWDIASAAWHWVPFYSEIERKRLGMCGEFDHRERIEAIVQSYGFSEISILEVIKEALARQSRVIELNRLAFETKDPLLQNWSAVNCDVVREDMLFTKKLELSY